MASAQTIQAMLDSVEAAIAGNPRGVRVREVRGRKIELMGFDELMRTRAALQAELSRATGGGFYVADFGRGGGR